MSWAVRSQILGYVARRLSKHVSYYFMVCLQMIGVCQGLDLMTRLRFRLCELNPRGQCVGLPSTVTSSMETLHKSFDVHETDESL
jgi:hypothetical protein